MQLLTSMRQVRLQASCTLSRIQVLAFAGAHSRALMRMYRACQLLRRLDWKVDEERERVLEVAADEEGWDSGWDSPDAELARSFPLL